LEAASDRGWPGATTAVPRLRSVSDRIAPTIAVMVLVLPEPGGLCHVSMGLTKLGVGHVPLNQRESIIVNG
jgi:hypothetical protein